MAMDSCMGCMCFLSLLFSWRAILCHSQARVHLRELPSLLARISGHPGLWADGSAHGTQEHEAPILSGIGERKDIQ